MALQAIDCQSFAGGFTLGVVQAGFELVGKREERGGFGVQNCLANRHLLGYNWQAEAVEPAEWTPLDVPFVFGNPPCSGFSVFTGDQSNRGIDAKVNQCMWNFVAFAARCRPLIAVFESVPGAYKTGRSLMQALRADLEERTGLRYELYHVLQDAYELGGVASRPRYFFVVSQIPFGVEYPMITRYPVLEDAWRDLDGMALTWEKQPYRLPPTSEWTVRARNGQVATDGHIGMNNANAQRVDDLLVAMRKHGGWPQRMDMYKVMRILHELDDVPDTSRDKVKHFVGNEWNTGFTCPVRWVADEPARVIVGGALALTVHPWQDRLITHREAARVMGFPDDWRILPSRKFSNLAPGWGKGITVDCGRWIGGWVRTALEGVPGPLTGQLIGEREHLINNPHPVKLTRGRIKILAAANGRRSMPVVDVAGL
jgi:DNA (cytosine-5)-methyltransferase 1